MKSTFSILYYVKRKAVKADGKCPIMGRITINGINSQFGTKVSADPAHWNVDAGKITSRNAEALQANAILESIKASMTKIYRQLLEKESFVTPERIKNIYFGIETSSETLLTLFEKHNQDVFKLIGNGKTKATYQKYERTRSHLANFLKTKYNLTDIPLKEISHIFLMDFEVYLLTDGKCKTNTMSKFMQFFKRIIIIAKNNGWLSRDPFANYRIKLQKVDRGYLTKLELEKLINKTFPIKRLEQVRDIFIFSCFTGLSYIDVNNLKREDIKTSIDDKLWIMKTRHKSKVSSNIPLLDVPQMILAKYQDFHPEHPLPVLSNQKMNSYLKEIGDQCGIAKDLTFHLARHTFATTITLTNGVPIESVSKMLGHTNLKTTQIYARIIDAKVNDDMALLANKLSGMTLSMQATLNIQ
jgi:site-specific recombinase XerD